MALWQRVKGKPFAVWTIFGGFASLGSAFLIMTAPFLLTGGRFVATMLIFVAIFFGTAFLALTQKRWAFMVTTGVGIFLTSLFLLISVSSFWFSFSEPASPDFWLTIFGLPILLLATTFSILSLRSAKEGLAAKRYLASPQSTGGLLTIVVVGFVIGGLVVWVIAVPPMTQIPFGSGRGLTSDIQFVLDDPYRMGETVEVKIRNVGPVAYGYNPRYEACDMSYFDASGRRFKIPPGTHCDIGGEVFIQPGEGVTLFTWNLDECTIDRWGCVMSRPLAPGRYTIRGEFSSADRNSTAIAEESMEITEGSLRVPPWILYSVGALVGPASRATSSSRLRRDGAGRNWTLPGY